MSVLTKHTIVPKHALTLMEALIVNVIVAIYWILMELLVIVCSRNNNNVYIHTAIISIYIIDYYTL